RHTRSKRDWSSDVCSSDLRVVGRIDVDDLDLPAMRGQHRGERWQIVADDQQVLARVGPVGCAPVAEAQLRSVDEAATEGEGPGRSEERRVGRGGSADWGGQ